MMENLEVDLEVVDSADSALSEEEMLEILQAVLDDRDISRPCLVSLSVVPNGKMRQLNLEWRDRDAPTDVLSIECEHPDDPDLDDMEPCMLGDIVLAPEYIAAQAAQFGTTPADETRLMLVHGMLHLLGYDHMDEGEALVMQGIEDSILERLPSDGTLGPAELTRHREEDDQA